MLRQHAVEVLLLVAIVLVSTIATSSAQGTAPPLGGVTIGVGPGDSPQEIDQVIARAHELHARLVRVEIRWSMYEPRAPGQMDQSRLAALDHIMSQASAEGMRTVALVERTPCWASSAPESLLRECVPESDTQANAWPPRDPGAYGAFTGMLTRRYGSELAAIEVWNEPDQSNEHYFAGPEKATRYAAILRAAYTAIKQADPSVKVLGASIVGSNGAFLKSLYAAGIKGYYDGLSVHFYNLVLASLRSIHEVQLANGDHTPVWLNEFGWSSCWPSVSIQEEQACVTTPLQGRNLADTIRSLAHTPWMAAEIMYEMQSTPGQDFGVFSRTGERKGSFAALQSVFMSPFGKPTPVTLRLRRHHGRLLAAGGGPVGDYMGLRVFKGSTVVYRALFTMNRFNRYSIALPKALGTRHLRVTVFQYWAGPARGATART